MGKRPAPSPRSASPAPSPAKKIKSRPTRAAAQRAQDAVHREAQPLDPHAPSELEVIQRNKAKQRRRAAQASTPSKKTSQAPASRSTKERTPGETGVGELVVTPSKTSGVRPTVDTAINKYFQPSKTSKSSAARDSSNHARGDQNDGHPEESVSQPSNSRAHHGPRELEHGSARKGKSASTSKKSAVSKDIEEPSDDEYSDTPPEDEKEKNDEDQVPERHDVDDSDSDIPDDIDSVKASVGAEGYKHRHPPQPRQPRRRRR